MKKTTIKDTEILYKIEQNNRISRKSIEHLHGIFKVRYPEGETIDAKRFLKRNSKWVLESSDERDPPKREFVEGETFQILGEEKSVNIQSRRSNSLEKDLILAEHLVKQTSVKDQLEKLLREESRKEFTRRTEKYCEELGKDYSRIFVRDQSTRWGSCSGRDNLNYNWRLILGPEHVLDYIVAHEVSHLEIKDHSSEFWGIVERLRSDYRRSQEWLNENSIQLVFDPEDI